MFSDNIDSNLIRFKYMLYTYFKLKILTTLNSFKD